MVLKESLGGKTVASNCQVKIDYKGYLKGNEGKKTFETGRDFTFVTGQGDVIKGMDIWACLAQQLARLGEVSHPLPTWLWKKGRGQDIPPCRRSCSLILLSPSPSAVLSDAICIAL